MKNIDNKQLRKLIRDRRFKTTVRNWGSKSTTYEYRITNVKLNYGKEDPTTSKQNWRTTVINLVCSGTTTNLVLKKRPAKGWRDMSEEERVDKRYSPKVRDCMDEYGEWYYNLQRWGNPKSPRNSIRYSLLNDDYDYNANRRANDIRSFLKLIGIEGDLKIGTIKLVHRSEL
jgi:hypothetical protein